MPRTSMTSHFTNAMHDFVSGVDVNETNAGEVEIAVDLIDLTSLQYRKYYDPIEVEEIGKSLLDFQIQAIMVRPAGARYQLVVGQKRLLGCRAVGKQTVRARIEQVSDEKLVELALIENMSRSNPNPVEECEGILSLITMKTGLSAEEIKALLNREAQGGEQKDNVVLLGEWKTLTEVLRRFSITPGSFRKHRLPLLALPSDVLEALQKGQLEYTKALAIAKVKDDDARQQLLREIGELSLIEIKEKIANLKGDSQERQKVDPIKVRSGFQSLSKRLGSVEDPQVLAKLASILKQAEKLLG